MKAKFELGDTVRCIEGKTKGAGWRLGLEFTITKVETEEVLQPLYWEGFEHCGVYEDSLELVRVKNLWRGKKR